MLIFQLQPAIESSEMYKAMSKRPSSVRPLRTPVTKPSGQKSKISSSRPTADPRVTHRVLQRQRIKDGQQKPAQKSSSATSNHMRKPIPTSTPTSPSAGSKNARLPNWAVDNINGANLRHGKRDFPASSRTTTPKE
jgi:hypothetical protein